MAGAVLEALDAHRRGSARQIAADELVSGRTPIRMAQEQESLYRLGGRLTDNRGGDTWAQELAPWRPLSRSPPTAARASAPGSSK